MFLRMGLMLTIACATSAMLATVVQADDTPWSDLSLAPGGHLTAWLSIPADRRKVDDLISPESIALSPDGAVLPVSWTPEDVRFYAGIRSKGASKLWQKGGSALQMLHVDTPTKAHLRAGLPSGAKIYLDGALLCEAKGNRTVPETLDVPTTLTAGPHLLVVTLPRGVSKSWSGRGFSLRWLDDTGAPLTNLRTSLPETSHAAALKAGLFDIDAKLVWQGDNPAWVLGGRFAGQLPKALIGKTIELRAAPQRPSASPKDLPTSHCTVAPNAQCGWLSVWPNTWAEARGFVGPVNIEARVTGDTDWTPLTRWGRKEPLSKLLVEDLARASRVQALLKTSPHHKGAGADTVRFDLQQLDDLILGETLKPLDTAQSIRRRLQRAEKALEAGLDPLDGVRGLHQRAYRSPFDGRYQPYALYVPDRIDPAKPLPFVVGLHGFRGTPMRICRIILQGTRPRAIVACPFGYGDTLYRHAGEDDMFRVMSEVSASYPVNPARVHLTGVSNGGLGAYEVALNHPDVWASVAVLAAVGNMRDFGRIAKTPHTPYEDLWLDRVSAFERTNNARHMTFAIIYGAKDRLPHTSVEKMVYALRRGGARVAYTLHDDLGHNVWDKTYEKGAIFRWFAPKKLRRNPARIDLTARSPRYNTADGAIIQRADWSKTARLQVKWTDTETTAITTAHITEARIPARPSDAPRAVRIDVDGEGHTIEVRPEHTTLALVREPDGWKVWPETAAPPIRSWPRPDGRFAPDEFFGGLDQIRGGPQLYVYGTALPAETALNRQLATIDRDRWALWSTMRADVVADTSVTEQMLASHHVILVGTPASHKLMTALVPDVEARIEKQASEEPDVGYRAILPNPKAPGLGLILSTGTTARGTAISVGLPEILPDAAWASTKAISPPYGLLLGDRELLAWE